jgi:multidrug efflux pump subunit AcrA (membrane-fusion protein)
MKFPSCFANTCFATVLLSAFACSPAKEEQKAPEKFLVINPVVADTIAIKEYVAVINSLQFVEIRTKLSGYLENIHVDEGQRVSKGQLLFTPGRREYSDELTKAKSQLKSAIAEAKAAEVDVLNVMSPVYHVSF